ncbi:MAG: MFS transporter, partial [Thermomicrobiales bacterium]
RGRGAPVVLPAPVPDSLPHTELTGPGTAGQVSIGLLGALGFLVVADARVIDPLLPVIADRFGTSVAAAGLTVSAYTLPYGVFQLVYGPLGDRVGKLRVMSVAILCFALGTAACAAAATLPILVALRFATGVAAAALIPLTLAHLGDTVPYEGRQAALGRYLSALAMGQILGASLGASVADFLSWRLIFLVYGLAALVMGLVFSRAVRRQPPAALVPARAGGPLSVATLLAPYRAVVRERAAQVVLGTVALEGLCFFGGFVYVGAALRDRFGLPYAAIGAILACFGLGGLVYSRLVGRLLPLLGERGLVRAGGSVITVAYVALAVVPDWRVIPALVFLAGIGFYSFHSTLQTKATELAPGARGTAVALFAFCLFLGQSTGAVLFGQLVGGFGYGVTLVASALLTGAIAATFSTLVRTLPGGSRLPGSGTTASPVD